MRLIDIDALDWEEIEAEHGKRNEVVVDCETFIESAPTVNQWIPCDIKMPNEDGYYLVTVEFDYGREIEMGWLLDGEWVNENSHVTVAWMPLPEVWENNDE